MLVDAGQGKQLVCPIHTQIYEWVSGFKSAVDSSYLVVLSNTVGSVSKASNSYSLISCVSKWDSLIICISNSLIFCVSNSDFLISCVSKFNSGSLNSYISKSDSEPLVISVLGIRFSHTCISNLRVKFLQHNRLWWETKYHFRHLSCPPSGNTHTYNAYNDQHFKHWILVLSVEIQFPVHSSTKQSLNTHITRFWVCESVIHTIF